MQWKHYLGWENKHIHPKMRKHCGAPSLQETTFYIFRSFLINPVSTYCLFQEQDKAIKQLIAKLSWPLTITGKGISDCERVADSQQWGLVIVTLQLDTAFLASDSDHI